MLLRDYFFVSVLEFFFCFVVSFMIPLAPVYLLTSTSFLFFINDNSWGVLYGVLYNIRTYRGSLEAPGSLL